MRKSWPVRWADTMMNYVVCLPWTLTYKSKSRIVRLSGLFIGFAWLLPMMLIVCIPLLLLMFAFIVAETWNEGE